MDKANQQLLILTGFRCNNNCIICSIAGKEKNYPDRTYDEVVLDLKRGINKGCGSVEFTGGEPTIRKDIILLVAEAKKLGYTTISLSTNGRFFSYQKFSDNIIKAGLNKITFSLLGPRAQIHDAITRTPNTFNQIIKGIKNVQQHKQVHINISTVISRLNYENLSEFADFVLDIGVTNWYLLDLIPDGNAIKSYEYLVVEVKDLYNEFILLKDRAKKFKSIGFFDFPLCLFSENLREIKNVMFINAKERNDTSKQVGYNPERITQKSDGKYEDIYRKNVAICRKCKFFKQCSGIWKRYLKKYGDTEIIELARINNCIK